MIWNEKFSSSVNHGGQQYFTIFSLLHPKKMFSISTAVNKWYILEVDVEYPKHLLNLHSDLPFLAERMKIKKSSNLNLYDKKESVVYIRAVKQALTFSRLWWGLWAVSKVESLVHARVSYSKVYPAGKLQWHFTHSFDIIVDIVYNCHLRPLLQSWRSHTIDWY